MRTSHDRSGIDDVHVTRHGVRAHPFDYAGPVLSASPVLADLVEWMADWDIACPDRARALVLRFIPSTTLLLQIHYRTPIAANLQFGSLSISRPDHRRHFVTRRLGGVLVVRPRGPLGTICAHLRPEAAARLLGERLQCFLNTTIGLDDLFAPGEVALLEEMLSEATTSAERFGCVERFLAANLREPRVEPMACRAAALLRRDPDVRISWLAAALGVSQRHLSREFQAMFGTSPKQFARLARIESMWSARARGATWFIVPLGDLVDRRRLVVGQGALSIVALLAVATARTAAILFISLAAMGLLAVVVQVLVAFAATLATPAERGKAVGMVTSGVVIGILAARFVAGLLADFGGWRAVYLTSAILTAVMVGLLMRVLPRNLPPDSTDSYSETLRSIPVLFLRDRVLLVRGVLALLIFAAFSTLWTALVLPLSAAPFNYSHTQIGLFGLVGLAGATAATGAGRLADRGLGQWTTGLSLMLLLLSWGLIAFLSSSIPVLLVGIILLDLAVQAVHVTNQSIIFARHPEARSRLVGGYMVFYSIGSAIGAITATTAYAYAGWRGVSMVGAAYSATAWLTWARTRRLGQGA